MVYRNFNCNMDSDNLALAKAKGINVSKVCREALEAQLWLKDAKDDDLSKDEIINKLNMKIAKLIEKVGKAEATIRVLEDENRELKEREEKRKWM